MASKKITSNAYETNLMAKAKLMMHDILPHHPELGRYPSALRKYFLENSDESNVERMFEKTLAHIGDYKFTNGDHCDFSDKSDAKTSSVTLKPTKPGASTHMGRITGIGHVSGSIKSGAIRLAVYIAPKQKINYYYLPKKFWSKLNLHTGRTGEIGISFSYNSETDTIPKFEFCRVKNIIELAKAKG